MNKHTYFCEHCSFTSNNIKDINIHKRIPPCPCPSKKRENEKNYIELLEQYCPHPREIKDVFNTIRIDEHYPEDFYQYEYKHIVVNMIQKAWNQIPFLERPLFYFGNRENRDMDVYYIYHKGKWTRETELQWTNELLMFESEDEEYYPTETETIILEIFDQFTDHLLADIKKYKLKVKNYFDFELKNKLEIIFNTKSKIYIIKQLMNIAKVHKSDFYCH